ncbi:MAG TPA: PP2C family protein-serine/threonine phosphatase [Solirubrobacteraceae bacterium]|nr:PP2C family protein-serine/threonine phosphatase [Solirubrobacteraceae bacterium]
MTDSGPVSSSAAPARETTAGGDPGDERPAAVARGRWPYWPALGVAVLGLAITGVLVILAASTYTSNENRLLKLRVSDAGALIAEALPSVQTPLASAAALADATGGSVQKFESFIGPYVGPAGRSFDTVSLWHLGPSGPQLMATVGTPPVLAASPQRAAAFFARAAMNAQLGITLLQGPRPRLGYAFTSPGLTGHYVAYGESALPANRRSTLASQSPFTDLHYALYLGRAQNNSQLLVTDLKDLPIRGQHASTTIRFGDSAFTFVVSAKHPLEGTFAQRLPWAIGIVGVLISLGAAFLTARLLARRNQAERLAGSLERIADENRRLYAEQRTIAQTLQHALLPAGLPKIQGIATSARYEAGVEGVDIGGDWYDLIGLDNRRLLLVVGDVSGRGLRAAATMAELRFAIHAYAAQEDPPAVILSKLSRLVNVTTSGHIATILCAMVDVERRRVTVTSAGHLPPLMISDGTGTFIHSEVGVPIGVRSGVRYTSTAVDAPPAATLLAFTDGLVERRGESIDAGLERLERAAVGEDGDLEELLDRLISDLRGDGGDDDTAIAGLRWLN